MDERKHRVLIVGGGQAGVAAARRLGKLGVGDVALVSRETTELWRGLMPQLLSGDLQPEHVLIPLRETLPGIAIYHGEVREMDLENRRAVLNGGTEGEDLVIGFDYAVIAVGAVADVTRFPGMAEHAIPTRSLEDFLRVRNQIVATLEAAARVRDVDLRRALLTIVVVGAGFTGIEVAAEAAALVRRWITGGLEIDPAEIRIVSLDVVDRILAALPAPLAAQAAARLREIGVEVRLGVGVVSASASGVRLSDGERIATRTLVATAGTATNPLVAGLGRPLERGRLACAPDGSLVGLPHVYGAGDAAAIPSESERMSPQLASHALAQGRLVADNIAAAIRGEPGRPYANRPLGEVAILGRGFAVAHLGGRAMRGWGAALVGYFIFLGYMPSWKRRLRLVFAWAESRLLGGDNPPLHVAGEQGISRMRFESGEWIVRAGDLGNNFYVITDGEVEVCEPAHDGERRVRRLGPGATFGERAFLGDGRRTASVRALRDTRLIAIDRGSFDALQQVLVPTVPAVEGPTALDP